MDVHREGFTPANALELASAYDVIVDATDNAASRYLISDACVIAQRPLVSGAALGTDGQLTVYNHGPDGAVCFRKPFALRSIDFTGRCFPACLPAHPLATVLVMSH